MSRTTKKWGGVETRRLLYLAVGTYGATCHLCHQPIDLSLRFPDKMCGTLDHIVPKARGGSDALENLRPAHFTCNSSRQAKSMASLREPTDERAFFGHIDPTPHPARTTRPDTPPTPAPTQTPTTPRRVVLVCGPPCCGKTTLAHTLATAEGLEVYDLDDDKWQNQAAFTHALSQVGQDSDAHAVVIRAGATRSARAKARALVNATEVRVITDVSAAECKRRVIERNRPRPPIRQQVAAVDQWWRSYQP